MMARIDGIMWFGFGPSRRASASPIPSAYKSHFSFGDKERGEERRISRTEGKFFWRRAKLLAPVQRNVILAPSSVPRASAAAHDIHDTRHRLLKNGTRRTRDDSRPPRCTLHCTAARNE